MAKRYLVSVAPASAGLFRQELRQDSGTTFVESLDEWRSLCELPPEQRYIFALHRFEVEFEARLEKLELERVASHLVDWLKGRDFTGPPFGIQITANLRMDWSFADLVEAILLRAGLPRENFAPRQPQRVLSVYLHQRPGEGRIFAGVSSTEENWSSWSSGQCRIPRDPQSISRAEAKLIEGWEAFSLPRTPGGLALDLGAAPGGWSRVLSEWGYEVHAVDPAELDPRVLPRVVHHQETAGRFLSRPGPQFDLLVCDMKMEASKVAEFLLSFRGRLKPGALLFTTLKLGKGDSGLKEASQALEILAGDYSLLAARQLFFNRSEISVALSSPALALR